MNNKKKILALLAVVIVAITIYMVTNGYIATIVMILGCVALFFDEKLPMVPNGVLLGVFLAILMVCMVALRGLAQV